MEPVSGSNPSVSSSSSSSSSASTAVIPAYPFTDTLAILTIFAILPSWLSVLLIILYISLGSSRIVGSTLSLFFKHKWNGLHIQDTSIVACNGTINDPLNKSSSTAIVSAMSCFAFDFVIAIGMLFISPWLLDYTHLLAKAFIASNLASTKQRYILNALLSALLILFIENASRFAVEYISIMIQESGGSISLDRIPSDLIYSSYLRYPKKPLKLLLYHLSLTRINSTSRIVFGFEHLIEFIYTTFSVYTIMHNLNPLFKKLVIFNSISKSLDKFTAVSIPSRLHINNNNNNNSGGAPNKPTSGMKNRTESTSQASVPTSTQYIRTITISPEISKSKLPSVLLTDEAHTPSSDTLPESEEDSNDSTPASFPIDHQILNMNDISSTTLVVAQNFENYCRVVLFPSLNSSNSSSSAQTLFSSNAPGSTTTLANSKLNPYLEKKMKYIGNKTQQPIWAFVSAAKTMFGSQDLHSGEYYQNNALVTTGRRNDDFTRSFTNSAQCFIWYTGETAVAFELRNVSVQQLLVRVNGIEWDQTYPRGLYGRELVIVSGLSPLSQYDIDFINVNDKKEQELLATTTVSTIHKNMILTESKPSTPLATLQDSVVTTKAAIEREKLKLKKLKADWRKKSSALKTEIENLNNRSNLTDESRNYKKVESLRQAVAKAESELTVISSKSETLRYSQAEVDERYLDEKTAFESDLRALQTFENQYNNRMDEQLKIIKGLTNDKNLLLQKKEKLLNKKAKILNDANKFREEIERFKIAEVKFRQDKRKSRANQRMERFSQLLAEISKFEKQMKRDWQNSM